MGIPLENSSLSGTADRHVIVHFRDAESGQITGPQMALPYDSTKLQLMEVVRSITGADETQPYSLFLGDDEILRSLNESMNDMSLSSETVLTITFQPEAVFRVRSVGRCTSTLPGHTEAILHVQFSPDGKHLATASGDTTVRIWEVNAEMPLHTLKGHKDWVMSVAWSPDGSRLVSGDKTGLIYIWDPLNGVASPKRPLSRGHSKWIMSFAWQPIFLSDTPRFASASKDGSVRIWNGVSGLLERTLSGHTACVTCIRWSGSNIIFSSSQDRSIRCWNPDTGILIKTLTGHGHWVNSLSLSSDYVLRTGPYDHRGHAGDDHRQLARDRFNTVGEERLISCSDDFTLFLWIPSESNKPIARLTGHQQPVNQISFSPDGRLIASAAFDHSIRIWDGITGRFLATLRGHVQAVYSVAWSADSRLLVSGSRDSTVKVWEIRTKKLLNDLPGHADEVFALDWSPDGDRVASGGRDRLVKFWRR